MNTMNTTVEGEEELRLRRHMDGCCSARTCSADDARILTAAPALRSFRRSDGHQDRPGELRLHREGIPRRDSLACARADGWKEYPRGGQRVLRTGPDGGHDARAGSATR